MQQPYAVGQALGMMAQVVDRDPCKRLRCGDSQAISGSDEANDSSD